MVDGLIDWLIFCQDWFLIYWIVYWLIDLSIYLLTYLCDNNLFINFFIDTLIDRFIDWLKKLFIDWYIDMMIVWLVWFSVVEQVDPRPPSSPSSTRCWPYPSPTRENASGIKFKIYRNIRQEKGLVGQPYLL